MQNSLKATLALVSVVLISSACVTTLCAAGRAQTQKGKKAIPKKPTQTPGGANQVEGLNGKVGQMLFTGRWRKCSPSFIAS